MDKMFDHCCCDVTTLKLARKPVKLYEENPAGCAGKGKQSKGKQEKRKGRLKDNGQQIYVRKRSSSKEIVFSI